MRLFSTGIMLLLILFACSCRENNGSSGDLADFGKGNSYARLFDLRINDSGREILVRNPWQGGGTVVYRYELVKETSSIKANKGNQVIRTPVSRVICLSTTHVAMIDALGKAESILGVSGAGYVCNEQVREGIESGRVTDIGYDNYLNSELIVSLRPDLVIAYGIGSESAGYVSKIVDAGFPVIFIADYLEMTPLARAEWIKVFGLLFEREEYADSIFNITAKRYEELKDKIRASGLNRPKVLLGLPFKDTWFVSPGNSYISSMISDAGGEYLWSDTRSDVSLPMGLESVYEKAMGSEIWLNIGAARSVSEILSVDNRFGELPPLKNGLLYNNTKRLNAGGGNDYWESGVLNPDILLMDISSILHPGFLPGYEPAYYEKLR